MLEKILGTKTAAYIMLYLFHHGEVYARELSLDLGISLSAIQNALFKYEESGVILSKKMGNVRIFRFNQKNPLTKPLMKLVEVVHDSMTIEDKEKFFHSRKRPRRIGKPVLNGSKVSFKD